METNLGDEDFGDVIYGLGVGTFQDFARNYLTSDVVNIGHIGSHSNLVETHFYNGYALNMN